MTRIETTVKDWTTDQTGHLVLALGDGTRLSLLSPTEAGGRTAAHWRVSVATKDKRRRELLPLRYICRDEAMRDAEDYAQHRIERAKFNRQAVPADQATRIPPGRPTHAVRFADGILACVLDLRRGFQLSQTRNASIPAELRREDGWYEGDIDRAVVTVIEHTVFTAREHRLAITTLRRFAPGKWAICRKATENA